MINLTRSDEVKALKQNLRATFDTEHGKETMKFIEQIGSWYPTSFDSIETNEIIARDANRRLIAMLKTVMELTPEQLVSMAKGGR